MEQTTDSRIKKAIFLGGFMTFMLLYWPQPIFPLLAQEFKVHAAQASSIGASATGCLAFCLVLAGILSDRFGRKIVMVWALLISSILTVLMSLELNLSQVIAARCLLGASLSGIPSVAMAYLSEEMDRHKLGQAMGLYVAGNALGGMAGRLAMTVMVNWISWRQALLVLGVIGFISCGLFCYWLPPSRRFRAKPLPLERTSIKLWLASGRSIIKDAGLPWLIFLAFLIMGTFVAVYNFLEFRLIDAPYKLSLNETGAIFSTYLIGIVASTLIGNLSDRLGSRAMLLTMLLVQGAGLLTTLLTSLYAVILGLALFTFGFFGAHATASSWVGLRAGPNKGLASSFYLLFYYLGSSVVGTCAGQFWDTSAWPGVVAFLSAMMGVALAVSVRLWYLQPKIAEPTIGDPPNGQER